MITTAKVHRKLRVPKELLDILRYIRDATDRPIPRLVNICLKTTAGVNCVNYVPTTRKTSEAVDLWLREEYANIEAPELRARIAHALVGVNTLSYWHKSTGVPDTCPAITHL